MAPTERSVPAFPITTVTCRVSGSNDRGRTERSRAAGATELRRPGVAPVESIALFHESRSLAAWAAVIRSSDTPPVPPHDELHDTESTVLPDASRRMMSSPVLFSDGIAT